MTKLYFGGTNKKIRYVKKLFLFVAVSLLYAGNCLAQRPNILNKQEGSITFEVDENLPAPTPYKYNIGTGKKLLPNILSKEDTDIKKQEVVATSFSDTKLIYTSKDVFYNSIIEAFANHRPITLSPDMIWLIISQGFSSYVNDHPDEMRKKLVSHKGKMGLIAVTGIDLFSGNANWEQIVGDLADEVKKNTKGNIAQTITADFSTTGTTERIASQATLLDAVKKYFEYRVIYISCGIPSITIKGTPEDWQKVLDKTNALSSYGIGRWVYDLKLILKEFVYAAKGNPDIAFWKNIVMIDRPDRLRGEGGCGKAQTPTYIDGWILKFFPYDKGFRPYTQRTITDHMPSELVKVPFIYSKINPVDNSKVDTPMELWAGFVGYSVNENTFETTPQIGWIVMKGPEENQTLNQLIEDNKNWGIDIRVKEVPEILKEVGPINRLGLEFTDKVVLPQWMDKLDIGRLDIIGDMTNKEKQEILKRFPEANIYKK